MVTLNDYFETKDYSTGLIILAKHSKNRILLQNLTRRKNIPKLEHELKKIAETLGHQITSENEGTAKELKKEPNLDDRESNKKIDQAKNLVDRLEIVFTERKINLEDLPPELAARWQQNRDHYKTIRSLHEKLKLMHNAKAEDRRTLINQMTSMDEVIRKNWEKIDSYDPTSLKEPQTTISHKRLIANRTFIVRNLKKLAGLTDEVKIADLSKTIKERFFEVINAGESFSQDTLKELKRYGIES
jgi:hypothetical protein